MATTFSPYRNDLDPDTVSQLNSRLSAYKLGKFNNHYTTATRNPIYCSVTSGGVTVPEYPTTLFEGGMYETQFKPGPLLKQCAVRSGGDYGLVLEIEAEIQCNTLTQFERIEKAFLRLGNTVDVKFGYGKPRGSGYKSKSIKGVRVARFSFSTTPEGYWIAKFTGIAPGQQILDLEVHNRIETQSRKYFLGDKSFDVTGITDLMLHHAQGNGTKALDKLKDGEVIAPPIGGAIVAYTSDFLYSNLIAQGMGNKPPQKPENDSGIIHYYTLEYIVNLFNKELIPVVAKQSGVNFNTIQKYQIKFDSDLSWCFPSHEIRSAYPTNILLLGVSVTGGTSGNYKSKGIPAGKDFEVGARRAGISAGPATDCYHGRVNDRAKIWPGQILFEHKLVMQALDQSKTLIAPAENTSPKESEEGAVKVKNFFRYLFDQLSDVTGGMIKLRLALHPKLHGTSDPSDEQLHALYIFDENNGNIDTLKCWVFNPLAGDGSTRSCTVTSEVGSAQYQGFAVLNTKKATDPIAEVQVECTDGNTTGRINAAAEAAIAIEKLIYTDGALGQSFFNEIHMQSIRQQLGALRMGAPQSKKMDLSMYPGLGMDVTMDGVFGFMPGNAIFSTQVPSVYKKAKSYFLVEQVENIFDGNTSDWSTTLKAKLAFHTDVTYIGAQ